MLKALSFHPWKSIRQSNLIKTTIRQRPTATINKSRARRFERHCISLAGDCIEKAVNARTRDSESRGRGEGSWRNFFTLLTILNFRRHQLGFHIPEGSCRRRRWRREKQVFESSTVVGRDPPPPRTSGTRLAARSRNYVVDIMQIRDYRREISTVF